VLGTWLGFTFRIPVPILIGTGGLCFLLATSCVLWRRAEAGSLGLNLRSLPGILFLDLAVILVAVLSVKLSMYGSLADAHGSPARLAVIEERGTESGEGMGDSLLHGSSEIEVSGVVTSDPVCVPGRGRRGWNTWKFRFRVEKLRREGSDWTEVRGWVNARWGAPRGFDGPRYGDRWQMWGKVRSCADARLRRCCLSASWRTSRRLSGKHGWRVVDMCYAARRAAAKRLAVGIADHPAAVDLLHALLLGYRSQLKGRTREVFELTGTLHIFAISGLHVGIVAGFIIFALRALRISRIWWFLFLAPLLVGYTVATGAKSSAVRACVMAVVYFLAPLLGRKADGISALAAAAIAILIAAPSQLFDVGFIFSFVVVAGLLLLYPHLEGMARKLWERDPLRLQRERWFVAALRECGRYLVSLWAVSCAAWLASAPLMAYFFGRFAPIALLSNLVVVPLAFLIVLAGCLSLLAGSCVEWFSEIFNHANLALIAGLVRTMELMAQIPLGHIRVPEPPAWILALWYGALGLLSARSGLASRGKQV